jgi:Phage integrase, N-terminal SAM-like domain
MHATGGQLAPAPNRRRRRARPSPEPGRPARVGVPGLLPRGQHPRRLPPRPADWWRWCAGQDLDPLQVRRVHVDAYARGLGQQRRAAATVRRRLAVLSSFYRYAVAEGLLTVNPLAHVKRPPADDVSTTLGLDRAEAARFLDAAEAAGPVRPHAGVPAAADRVAGHRGPGRRRRPARRRPRPPGPGDHRQGRLDGLLGG